jgi:hypothetical protein
MANAKPKPPAKTGGKPAFPGAAPPFTKATASAARGKRKTGKRAAPKGGKGK